MGYCSTRLASNAEDDRSAVCRRRRGEDPEVRGQVGEVLRRARLLHRTWFISQRDEGADPTSLQDPQSRVPPGQEPGRSEGIKEVQPRRAGQRGPDGRRAAQKARLLHGESLRVLVFVWYLRGLLLRSQNVIERRAI